MNTVFLIAGGGTGAKVAEAFLHLCAAGHGPKNVHILFVDADTMNGNLQRAYDTGLAYQRMARFDWNVRTTVGGGFLRQGTAHETALFASNVYLYRITEPIHSDGTGALRTASRTDGALNDVLDLFYDKAEQETSCSDGFRARPNLGCILLGQHLRRALAKDDGRRFVEELQKCGTAGGAVPIVVAASLFGGMGASLLPIARSSVMQALREGFSGAVSTDNFRWASVMMLPHYQPVQAEDSVDPHRYLLDTSNALQFYQKTFGQAGAAPTPGGFGQGGFGQGAYGQPGYGGGYGAALAEDGRPYDVAYLVGSDNPGRNRVRTSLGTLTQANPAYFEEFVAALAVREFALAPTGGGAVRHFFLQPSVQTVTWDTLPLSPEDRTRLALSMGYLLHLSAFFLRLGNPQIHQLSQGMLALLRTTSGQDLRRFEFYKHAIDGWAEKIEGYQNAPRDQRPEVMRSGAGPAFVPAMRMAATEYCARLLHWSETSLRGDGLALMEFDASHYAALYGHLSGLNAEDFGRPDLENDNALVRLMRGTVASMLNAEANREQNGRVVGDFSVRRSSLSPGMEDKVVLAPRISLMELQETLRQEQMIGLLREYYVSRLDMAPVG